MEMTLFRSKNVFIIAYCNDIDYYNRIQNHIEYVDLKSEISEAHINYFSAGFKDIQF